MKLCPQCETGYPDSETACPVHGGPLTETSDLPAGLLIVGTYRILHKLGQGTMGSVYLVEKPLEGRELKALKFLNSELSSDESFTSRFLRAAKRLSELHHPNVLATGDLQSAEDGSLFFPMEYIDGPSLRVLLGIAPNPFDPGLALAITRCLAEGLGAAHAAGMIHLDLKPENVLIARDTRSLVPKITCFGIGATRESGNTFLSTGRVLLTPTYAAPEQWLNTRPELLDGRTDLYSLGEILFEMLTRETVFDAVGYHAWSRQHLTVPPRIPSELRPELAEWHGLDDLVLALLAKEPDNRPKDAAAVLALLDAVQFGLRPLEIPQAHIVENSDPIAEDREHEPPPAAEAAEEPAPESIPPSEAAEETTSAFTETLTEPIAEEEPVSAQEAPASFSPVPMDELAAELTAPEPKIQPVAPEPPAEPVPSPADDREASLFAAPEQLPSSFPSAEPEPTPVEANAFVPIFTAPEPLEEPVAASDSPLAAPELKIEEPEQLPAAEPEPATVEPNAFVPIFTAPEPMEEPAEEPVAEPIEEPLQATQTRSFAHEFRPAEPEFIPAAPEPPRASTPAIAPEQIEADEKPQDSALDMEELERIFGRTETAVKPDDAPRRSRTGASNFFDPPPGSPEVEEEPHATAEPTNFFGKPYTPSSSDAPPLPVSEPPPSVSFTEAFAAAGDAYRQSQAEPGTPLAHENSVDWVDSGRAADPATLRAALSTFPGATTVTGFNFQHQDLEEEDESEQHRGRTAFIVVAVLLVLAAAGFGIWRYMLNEANKPIAKLTPACTSGDGKACYDLAALNEQDKAASDGAVRATAFYAQACELNFPLACRKLGLKYLFGTGVAVDTQKAIDLFGKGCDKADIESCDNLADLYHEGKGVPMDDAKAAEIYNKACTAGDQVGCTWAKRLATPPPPVKRIPKRVAPADADSDSAQ